MGFQKHCGTASTDAKAREVAAVGYEKLLGPWKGRIWEVYIHEIHSLRPTHLGGFVSMGSPQAFHSCVLFCMAFRYSQPKDPSRSFANRPISSLGCKSGSY